MPRALRSGPLARAQIFAYGQTGSGKTHCMGTAAAARAMAGGGEGGGVIPRAVRLIFDSLAAIRDAYDVSLKVARRRRCHPMNSWLVQG
jgi:chromosomal replication initiation ATPase DnaA